jgi:hypothetical protein
LQTTALTENAQNQEKAKYQTPIDCGSDNGRRVAVAVAPNPAGNFRDLRIQTACRNRPKFAGFNRPITSIISCLLAQ